VEAIAEVVEDDVISEMLEPGVIPDV